MRYLLIDRIEYLEVNKSIRALKSVALSEDVFHDHFFGYPVMPGALLIESLAQAGTALLEYSADFKKKALLVMVGEAKFRKMVRPGDQLSVNGTLLSVSERSAQMDGEIRVAEKLVMNARLTFALDDADRFYPIKMRQFMETIYDVWLEDTEFKNDRGGK